jgi:hypothetical protein
VFPQPKIPHASGTVISRSCRAAGASGGFGLVPIFGRPRFVHMHVYEASDTMRYAAAGKFRGNRARTREHPKGDVSMTQCTCNESLLSE